MCGRKYGNYSIHYACDNYHLKILEILINEGSADLGEKRPIDLNTSDNSNSDDETEKPHLEMRYFKVVDPITGKGSGRYSGLSPKMAASKAYTKYLQNIRNSHQITLNHTLFVYVNRLEDVNVKFSHLNV